MAYRNTFRLAVAFLAVAALSFAEPLNASNLGEEILKPASQGGMGEMVLVPLAIDIAILIIYSLYGYFTQSEKELLNARNEFGQLLVSIGIILLSFVLFTTVSQMFVYQFQYSSNVTGAAAYSTITQFNSAMFNKYQGDAEGMMRTAYDKVVGYRADASVPTNLPMIYSSPTAMIICPSMSVPYIILGVYGPGKFIDALMECGFSFQSVTMRTEAWKGAYADALEMEINSMMSPFFNLMVFMIMIGNFFIDKAFLYVFFGGIILRMTPWTRKAGDLLVLLSMVACIFFPFLYAVFLGAAESVELSSICSKLGADASMQPFGDCAGAMGIMKLGKYAVLSSFVASVILGLSLSILNNFRKVFEMVE